MSNDYSRINFDPGQDYLGVLLQQGRPLMDADWNALVAQLSRRTHAGSYDTFGPAVVPETTPDGFLITPIAGGFTIGRGRIYVDGLLAENHGAGALQWDAHLAEEFRPDAVAWNLQPYGHVPVIPAGFPYLVYVDVWQREVGPLEDPREDGNTGTPGRLVDVAVGVDTTARLQTVWQVRTLGGLAAGTDCSTPLDEIAAWAAATAPSGGRLTTATGIVAGEPDPCLVPPLGGYKGGENQLYRVEVHTGGAPGTATFKWSRDNASVQSRVQTITGLNSIVVDSIGKDEVLRFNDGDWIEILDDARELNGLPGVLRRIAIVGGVSDSTRTLTLAAPLAAIDFPVDVDNVPVGSHTRVRKWNQAGIVKRADGTTYADLDLAGSNGEITIPADATQLLLENGILVSFGLAAGLGPFRSGDWWVFAARTNDASVEILNAAPPRGIHHHYSKLGVVLSATEADDCREIWPPDRGCCTVVVRPGESIQSAIDSLPDVGGCVCLKSGIHEIDAPLLIGSSNIVLHGEAPGTRVVGDAMDWMLLIGSDAGDVENVDVHTISFEYGDTGAAPFIIVVYGARRVSVHDCGLHFTGNTTKQSTGIYAFLSTELRFAQNVFERPYWGVYVDGSTSTTIADSTFIGALMDTPSGLIPFSAFGVFAVSNAEADIHGNRFTDFNTAAFVWVSRGTVTNNEVRRRALPAALDDAASAGDLQYAVVLAGSDEVRVHGNRIGLESQSYGGVSVVGRHDEITGNHFESSYGAPSIIGPVGVHAGDFSGAPTGGGDFATIADNHFSGLQLAVWAMNPQGVRITDNSITGVERAGLGVILESCNSAVVADNTLHDLGLAFLLTNGSNNRVLDNTAYTLRLAALVMGERALDFDGNSFDDVSHLGVAVLNPVASARFANSRVAHCGYEADTLAVSLGLLQLQVFALNDVAIDSCEILETGISPDGKQTPGVARAVISVLVSHLQIADNRIAHDLTTQLTPGRQHNAMWLVGVPCALNVTDNIAELAYGAALITGNVFQGPAQIRLVDLRRIPITDSWDVRFEKMTFANNRCDHTAEPSTRLITADLFGSHMIVNGNQIKTPRTFNFPIVRGHSFGFGQRPLVVCMGNYTTGDYTDVTTTVPAPIPPNNFNVIA